jgi:hypothetical protein
MLELDILNLQALQPLGFVLVEAAVLLPPAIQRLLGDALASAEIGGRFWAGLRLAQQADDLFGGCASS